jgi:hypothetical protein
MKFCSAGISEGRACEINAYMAHCSEHVAMSRMLANKVDAGATVRYLLTMLGRSWKTNSRIVDKYLSYLQRKRERRIRFGISIKVTDNKAKRHRDPHNSMYRMPSVCDEMQHHAPTLVVLCLCGLLRHIRSQYNNVWRCARVAAAPCWLLPAFFILPRADDEGSLME